MKNKIRITIFVGCILMLINSCKSTKYVGDDEFLLTKTSIKVNDKTSVDDAINDYLAQRPNNALLGIPLALYFHNIGNKDFDPSLDIWEKEHPKGAQLFTSIFSKKQAVGFRKFRYDLNQWWLKNGEEPVILSAVKTAKTETNLAEHFIQQGYFDVQVQSKTIKNNKKATILYEVSTNTPYLLGTITKDIASPVLDSIYKLHSAESLIISGTQYNYSNLTREIDRLTKIFRNTGIYRFNKNTINFEGDSINKKINTEIVIGNNDLTKPYKVQYIKKINIYTDFSYSDSHLKPFKDSIIYNGYHIYAHEKIIYNPKLLLNAIFISPNSIYKDTDRELTRRHLRELLNFSLVDIKYSELEDDSLEASIILKPLAKYNLGFSSELTHSNIRQLGISAKVIFSNRNAFKGAELFKFSIQGAFLDSKEASDNESILNAFEVGADLSLEIPRFLLPFNVGSIVPKEMSPKTELSLGTSLQKNIGLDKQKFNGSMSYRWSPSKKITHQIEVLNIQFIQNLNTGSYFNIYGSEYDDLENIQLEHFPNEELTTQNAISFIDTHINLTFKQSNPIEYQTGQNIKNRHAIITENFVIPTIAYSFNFNNSDSYKDTNFSAFKARLSLAGNLSTALSSTKNENGVKTVFDTPIAQYVRGDFEYKKYWDISFNSMLAFRSSLGIAIPYGNTKTMPFTKSYFVGGPNDLRAWKIYDLGPGSSKSGLEYNIGNLKFLTSLEYRFKILNSFKGAFFVDAGNIWNISNDEISIEEDSFNGLNSIKDIAVGTGFGMRYDLSFILIRIDIGFKTYEPYLDSKDKWFQNYFTDRVINFGISYPF